jgi:hypothetical protein
LGADRTDGFDFGEIRCGAGNHFAVLVEKIYFASVSSKSSGAIHQILAALPLSAKGIADSGSGGGGQLVESPFHSALGAIEGADGGFGLLAHFLLHDCDIGEAHNHGKHHEKKDGGKKKGRAASWFLFSYFLFSY